MGFSGTIAGGRVKPGDTVAVAKSGKTSTVSRIVTMDGDRDEAVAGDAIARARAGGGPSLIEIETSRLAGHFIGDAEARETYGPEAERLIEGPAGSGFLEDTSCYHKALAPVSADRLMLQFRYQ